MSASPYNRNVFVCGIQGTKEPYEHSVNIFDMGDMKDSNQDYEKKTLKVKAELKGHHNSNIHSLCWEENEANEGIVPKELITADSGAIVQWDLKTGQAKSVIQSGKIMPKSNKAPNEPLHDCAVVKRDPHHKNLLCVGIDYGFA